MKTKAVVLIVCCFGLAFLLVMAYVFFSFKNTSEQYQRHRDSLKREENYQKFVDSLTRERNRKQLEEYQKTHPSRLKSEKGK